MDRRGGMHIAYSTYNPPPPGEVLACLDQGISYLRKEGMGALHQTIIQRMAIFHIHFEAVHPFHDGNGRTGRLLLPLIMAADGHTPVYLSAYIDAHKEHYYSSLKAGQQRNDPVPLIRFIANAISGSVQEVLVTRQALLALESRWRHNTGFRRGSTAERALALLPHYPVFTMQRLAKLLDVSIPAVIKGVGQLHKAGIIREKTGYRRNRIFVTDEALLIINRPFGHKPV